MGSGNKDCKTLDKGCDTKEVIAMTSQISKCLCYVGIHVAVVWRMPAFAP